jgi:hypothetical protein
MPGPYNIDDSISPGDPGAITWAIDVAQAVNDLHTRAAALEAGGGVGGDGAPPLTTMTSAATWRTPRKPGSSNLDLGSGSGIRLWPVYFPEPFLLSGMAVKVAANLDNDEFELVIYDDDSGFFPTNKLVSSGVGLAPLAAGYVTLNFTEVAVPAGLLWLGIAWESFSSLQMLRTADTTSDWIQMPWGSGSTPAADTGIVATDSFVTLGSLPDPFVGDYSTTEFSNLLHPVAIWMKMRQGA